MAQNFRFPVPTQDEVARINGRPFTVGDFLLIRSQTEKPTPEIAYWLGVSALVLQDHKTRQGQLLSGSAALQVARYALQLIPQKTAVPALKEYYASSFFKASQRTTLSEAFPSPEEVKKEIEQLTQRAVIVKNPTPISQFY